MKHLLTIVVLLCVPMVGWAGEPSAPKPGDTILFMPGIYDKDHPPQLAPKDFQCLAAMAAAMKAGEPYIFEGQMFSYPWITDHPQDLQERLGQNIVQTSLKWQMEGRLAHITKLWAEAKQCWKDQP